LAVRRKLKNGKGAIILRNKFGIERLEGRGITAKVVNVGKQYSTYNKFAVASGYSDAAVEAWTEEERKKSENGRKLIEKTVDVLAKGKHEHSNDVIYVVQDSEGERFLFEGKGLEIKTPPQMPAIEALTAAHSAIDELRRKAYAEGFDAGRAFVAESEQDVARRVLADAGPMIEFGRKRAQEIRDKAIEQAKADVVDCEHRMGYTAAFPFAKFGRKFTEVEFVINRQKRTVVALIRYKYVNNAEILARGIAKCAPDDCFNSHIGRATALRRALGLDVPAEYINAPQPTEVRVGDIVRGKNTGIKAEVESVDGEIAYGRYEDGYRLSTPHVKIIDDSREGVAE